MSTSIQRTGSEIVLSAGSRSVTFASANAGWVRDRLTRFLQTRGGRRSEHSAHGETLVSKGGGTDPEPQVWISSESADGDSRGSVWLDPDQARSVLADL